MGWCTMGGGGGRGQTKINQGGVTGVGSVGVYVRVYAEWRCTLARGCMVPGGA